MFVWKDDYNTGISEIDAQHRQLFKLGSQIFDLVSLDDGFDHYDEIINILNDLREYTIYHFDFEEKYMLEIGYEDFDNHKELHDKLIDKITNIETKDIDSDQRSISLSLLDFIATWIGNHILKEDFKYAKKV